MITIIATCCSQILVTWLSIYILLIKTAGGGGNVCIHIVWVHDIWLNRCLSNIVQVLEYFKKREVTVFPVPVLLLMEF